jgi:hypothetical protein
LIIDCTQLCFPDPPFHVLNFPWCFVWDGHLQRRWLIIPG